jgi:tRNA A-37 threonylcarbamoyl transferase component Bud32
LWVAAIALIAVAYVWGKNSASAGSVQRAIDEWVGPRLPDLRPSTPEAAARLDAAITWSLVVLRWTVVATLIWWKRWRHLAVFVGSVAGVAALARWFPTAGLEGTGVPSHPSLAAAGLAVTLAGVIWGIAPRGRWRRLALLGAAVVTASLAGVLLVTQMSAFSEVAIGLAGGFAIPAIGYRVFAPEAVFPVTYRRARTAHLEIDERREAAIRTALDEQLGLEVASIAPFGLAGSGASTPLKIVLAGGATAFGKLYAVNHMRADRWYKLGRSVLYGALEDERSFNSVRRMVEYEDYMLRYLRDQGVLSAPPIGFVELTPEREYLLVTGFVEGGVEMADAVVDEDVIRSGIGTVAALWTAGLAHRDIKPSNVLVRDHEVVLIDDFFCQVRPSAWRQAVDLANMMLTLALRSTPDLVYRVTLERFTPDDVAEAFAATRGVTIPGQLRNELRADGRDLRARFAELAPAHAPIRVQRWSLRRIASIAIMTAGIVVALTVALQNLEPAGFGAP